MTFPLDLRRYASVTSTMDVAAEAVDSGAAEGLVIVADEQTAGRGRRGRIWSSPAGAGLYLSFVLRPPLDPDAGARLLALVTLTAGVAVREAIVDACGLVTELKWPNDVMMGRRKLGGILAEGIAIGTTHQAIVLGVGLNVRPAFMPDDIAARATSLETELGRRVDREALLEALLATIPSRYDGLRRGGTDDILRAWREAAPAARSAFVEWSTLKGVRRGVTAGIDDTGALLVQTDSGVERIIAGEITWF